MKTVYQLTDGEIWDGWCGNASPSSDEGSFITLNEALEYVREQISDWGNEELEIDDNGDVVRYISDLTEDEINHIAQSIYNYSNRDN